MSELGITVERLGKRYKIVGAGERSRIGRRSARELLWALRDVSFAVQRGGTLGIIGRNGSGKTTLLKVLSRITPPTEGRALLSGTVSSLLEVGTGFHGELTGRENVYLNGAVLGMRKREVATKFDEIVEFSEVGRFIDTPVKRYSSGMALRLAASVAAHLEPEILLVDEVLAVGDAAFQAKCLGKMGEAAADGRTVVIVSHSMPTIASFADRCIWLDEGRIAGDGPPDEVIRSYLQATGVTRAGVLVDLRERRRAPGHALTVRYAAVRLLDATGAVRSTFYEGEPITIEATLEVLEPASLLERRAYIKTVDGIWLFSAVEAKHAFELRPGRWMSRTTIDPNHLRPGEFRVDLSLQTASPQDSVEDAVRFSIEHNPGGHDIPIFRGSAGLLRFDFDWSDPEPVSPTTDET